MLLVDLIAILTPIVIGIVALFVGIGIFFGIKRKSWDKIVWIFSALAGALLIFGWIAKAGSWDPLLW